MLGLADHSFDPARASSAFWLVLSASATAGIMVAGKRIPLWSFGALLVLAAACFFLLLRAETQRPSLRCATVFWIALALMALAVAIPPRTSNDVWAYSIYGRMVTEYHASPYVHAPEAFPQDPYFPRAKSGYHNIKSVYGPAFTAISTGVMEVAGDHTDVARALFQSLAALSVLGALLLLWRKTRDASVLAFAGINPVVAASIVNGGHNDAMVGVAVLSGAYAAPAHPVLAGLILGLAASIKIIGLLPLGAVALWTLYRRGRRAAAALLATGLGILAAGYAAAGGFTALAPLSRGERLVVRHSIWFYPRQWITGALRSAELTLIPARDRASHIVGLIGVALIVSVAVVLLVAYYRKQRAEELAGASLVPYLLGASYILPWYPGWILPSLAPTRKSVLARLAAVDTILLFAVDPDRLSKVHGTLGLVAHGFARDIVPLLELIALLALFAAGIRTLVRRRRSRHNRHNVGGEPLTPVEDDVSRAAPA
jgi:hypothetical protein